MANLKYMCYNIDFGYTLKYKRYLSYHSNFISGACPYLVTHADTTKTESVINIQTKHFILSLHTTKLRYHDLFISGIEQSGSTEERIEELEEILSLLGVTYYKQNHSFRINKLGRYLSLLYEDLYNLYEFNINLESVISVYKLLDKCYTINAQGECVNLKSTIQEIKE